MNQQDISLDLGKETRLQQPIRIRQGDLEGTTVRATIYDGGVAAETTGLSAYFVMELPDREHYYRKQAALSGNVATVTIDEAEAASVTGTTDNAYFQLVGDGVIYSTSRFTVVVLKGAIDGHDTAETYDGYVEDWLEGQTASIGSTMSNAITAMNNAANAAIANATDAAAAASAAATDAEGRIEAAIESAGDISELAVPLMSADTRGGAKLGDGLAVEDGTLHVGQLAKASTGEVYGPLASVTAKGHAEQDTTTGKQLFDRSTVTSGYLIASDGTETADADFAVSAAIAVAAGSSYAVSGMGTASGGYVAWYDSSDALVSTDAQSDTDFALTAPSGASKVRLSVPVANLGTTQLELGSTATGYEPYSGGLPSPRPDWEQPIEVVRGRNLLDIDSENAVTLNAGTITIRVQGTKIVRVGAGTITAGSRAIRLGNGLFEQNPGTNYPENVYMSNSTNYAMPLPAGTYTFSQTSTGTVKASLRYGKLNENGTLIKTPSSPVTFTVTEDCYYIIIVTVSNADDNVPYHCYPQLTLGSTPQPYVPYGHVGLEVRQNSSVVSATPIPLPQRGWVASLPDGTSDVLSIDSAGKVEWELADAETDTAATDGVTGTIGVDVLSTTGQIADGATVLYKLATPITEECGYVDLPDIPSEATVNIPELEDLGLTFWVDGDGTLRAAMRDWYERAHSEYADRLEALEEAVAGLVTGA